ncbi:MAG TPA: hypothetical protein VG944_01585, partial [Fimbriimonas sp.]|nr:hypothetical protein [Fimbriimonas sp.]
SISFRMPTICSSVYRFPFCFAIASSSFPGDGAVTLHDGQFTGDWSTSYISILLELGIDVRTIQELAGHSSSSITQETYARSRRELKRRAADTLASHLNDKVSNRVSTAKIQAIENA